MVAVILSATWRAAASTRSGSVHPHHFRDTAASLAVSAGADVKAVQRMLGHASAAMTFDVYSGLFADDLDRVAEQLNEAGLELAAGSTRPRSNTPDSP